VGLFIKSKGTLKDACEGNAFSTDLVGMIKIDGWVAGWNGMMSNQFDYVKHGLPVSKAIHVFTT
jgi:hypothetical protein